MIVTPFLNQRLLRILKYALFIALFYILISVVLPNNSHFTPKPRKQPKLVDNFKCPHNYTNQQQIELHFHKNNGTDRKVLVILDSLFSRQGRQIIQILSALKFPFKSEAVSKNLPILTTARRGRYSLIVIENYYKYLNMPRWNRQLLDKYCREFNVPVISFIASKPNDSLKRIKIKGSSLWMWQNQRIHTMKNAPSIIHKISRIGAQRDGFDTNDWVVFEETNNYEPIITGSIKNGYERAVVIRDKGEEDGVRRIIFGKNLTDWSIRVTFLDSLWWAMGNEEVFSLNRYIQVDIDDIFVGAQGTRMVKEDVNSLLSAQSNFRKYVQNFTFMLGFSGSYFRNGDNEEDLGDESLIENADHFIWFPHMWRHNHAHEHNYTYLESIMIQNKLFAKTNKLPIPYKYAIAPQHDGVFPIHEQMYDSWRKVWNVEVTATEEYPHFKPATARKGFIYKNISVLPRQTCGLYTHTQFFDYYPDGFDKVQKSIEGGELFFTILMNHISIFMTHQQNYAHDRLALYTFENLFRFLNCWTNLRLRWQDPISSANSYFKQFPAEKIPMWTNPCSDSRHKSILPPSLNCSNMTLPNLLIIGPQKTGSTALGTFLSLHPNVSQNEQVPGSFEEVQFFGGINYQKGIEWYLSVFRNNSVIFEKSATYFDNPLAPKQASSLIPDAKLIIILHNPSQRAYSWFQHILAHNDTHAAAAGDLEVILDTYESSNSSVSKETSSMWRKIRQRCVSGGKYIHHLDKWLENFSLSQIHFVDSDELKNNPISVLHRITKWLDLPKYDFDNHVRFSSSKGFHCIYEEGKTKCLGKSKGRSYPKMPESLLRKLDAIYELDNAALYKFLRKNRIIVPTWLEEAVRH